MIYFCHLFFIFDGANLMLLPDTINLKNYSEKIQKIKHKTKSVQETIGNSAFSFFVVPLIVLNARKTNPSSAFWDDAEKRVNYLD